MNLIFLETLDIFIYSKDVFWLLDCSQMNSSKFHDSSPSNISGPKILRFCLYTDAKYQLTENFQIPNNGIVPLLKVLGILIGRYYWIKITNNIITYCRWYCVQNSIINYIINGTNLYMTSLKWKFHDIKNLHIKRNRKGDFWEKLKFCGSLTLIEKYWTITYAFNTAK